MLGPGDMPSHPTRRRITVSAPIKSQLLPKLRLVEPDDYLTVNINHRHTHLPALPNHVIAGYRVNTYVEVLKGDPVLLKELLGPTAYRAGEG